MEKERERERERLWPVSGKAERNSAGDSPPSGHDPAQSGWGAVGAGVCPIINHDVGGIRPIRPSIHRIEQHQHSTTTARSCLRVRLMCAMYDFLGCTHNVVPLQVSYRRLTIVWHVRLVPDPS